MNMDALLTWLIGFGIFLPGALFLLLFLAFMRIRTWSGWNTVMLVVALVALTGLSFLTRLLGRPPMGDTHRGIFVLVVVVLIAVAFWQLLYQVLMGPTFNRSLLKDMLSIRWWRRRRTKR
jgi:multisubunit Na+/H+ antiporter MnhF subunit